jgi:cell division protease FtsH
MADALIKFETIDDGQIKEIMAGLPPSAPAGWEESVAGGTGSAGGGSAPRPQPQPGLGPAAGEGSAG